MIGLRWSICIALGALLALAGCGKRSAPGAASEPQRRAPAAQAADGASPAAESQAGRQPAEDRYAYDPLGKRDPFRSFVLDRMKEVDESAKGPLEQFELSQLSVLGVVWETDNARALVSDPSGQGYIIREGDAIGKSEGTVLRIDDNLVLVRETYVDYVGETTSKEIEMRVRQGQGG